MSERPAYQTRVIEEKTQLDERLVKLFAFTLTPAFDGLSAAERDRLNRQRSIMQFYSSVLAERIAAFDQQA